MRRIFEVLLVAVLLCLCAIGGRYFLTRPPESAFQSEVANCLHRISDVPDFDLRFVGGTLCVQAASPVDETIASWIKNATRFISEKRKIPLDQTLVAPVLESGERAKFEAGLAERFQSAAQENVNSILGAHSALVLVRCECEESDRPMPKRRRSHSRYHSYAGLVIERYRLARVHIGVIYTNCHDRLEASAKAPVGFDESRGDTYRALQLSD